MAYFSLLLTMIAGNHENSLFQSCLLDVYVNDPTASKTSSSFSFRPLAVLARLADSYNVQLCLSCAVHHLPCPRPSSHSLTLSALTRPFTPRRGETHEAQAHWRRRRRRRREEDLRGEEKGQKEERRREGGPLQSGKSLATEFKEIHYNRKEGRKEGRG